MSGEVGHFELPADNLERARRFYLATFGCTVTDFPGMDYTMVNTGPVDAKGMPKEVGFISGGIGKRGGTLAHPVVNITVDDISATEQIIEKNGGKLLQLKRPMGDGTIGWTGYFMDSEGNTVGLYQWPKTRTPRDRLRGTSRRANRALIGTTKRLGSLSRFSGANVGLEGRYLVPDIPGPPGWPSVHSQTGSATRTITSARSFARPSERSLRCP